MTSYRSAPSASSVLVARPEACCGLTLCEQRCPNGSLKISDGALIGDRPRLDDDLQALDVPGLYLAGDITGMPLARNETTPSCIIAGVVMPESGQFARRPPKPMGRRRSGSKPFTIAR